MSKAAKWVTTQALNINLDAEHPESPPRRMEGGVVRVGGSVSLGRLTNGLQSGASVAVFQIDLDDGTTVACEMSLRMLAAAVAAMKARDEIEGRPQ